MRFVAGRGTVAELLAGSAMAKMMPALWRRAIGKMLLARAPQWQRCWQVGAPWQSYWPEVPWRRGLRHCGRELSGRCCWQGRCGRDTTGQKRRGIAAGRPRCRRGRDAAARESHREEDVSGGGAPWRSCCRQPQEGMTTKKESDP